MITDWALELWLLQQDGALIQFVAPELDQRTIELDIRQALAHACAQTSAQSRS